MRKQIVHNKYVVQRLEQRGAVFVEETDEVPEGSIVVFSAHGVAPEVHEEAARRGLQTIDATCPLVTKVHMEARRFAEEGFQILLIGHDGHEEVVGTTGEAPDHVTLVDGPAACDDGRGRATPSGSRGSRRPRCPWTRPTETVRALRTRFPAAAGPAERRHLLRDAEPAGGREARSPRTRDLVIVVGSRNSSNSVRLVEVALTAGAGAAHLVDAADEIDDAWLDGVTTVGVTSGASVPEVLVDGVLGWLAERGFGDVETVESAQEHLLFALPPELRRDLKAEAGSGLTVPASAASGARRRWRPPVPRRSTASGRSRTGRCRGWRDETACRRSW